MIALLRNFSNSTSYFVLFRSAVCVILLCKYATCFTGSPQRLCFYPDYSKIHQTLLNRVRFVRSDSPLDCELYGDDVVIPIRSRLNFFPITKKSLVFSERALFALDFVFLSNHAMSSKHSSATSHLLFNGTATLYRCRVVVIVKEYRLLPYETT